MKIILWLFTTIAIGSFIITPISDPDLWWHITVGKWIIAHKNVPYVDYWTSYSTGKPWIAYSWSNEVILALIDKYFSISGLYLAKCLLIMFVSLSFSYIMSKITNNWLIGLFLGVLTSLSCFNFYSLRPQTLSWLYFAYLIYTLELIKRDRIDIKKILSLIFISVLWANTHITTIFIPIIVVGWLYNGTKTLPLILKVTAICLLATLITPYLGREWLVFFTKANHPLNHRIISEFQPGTVLIYSVDIMLISIFLFLIFAIKGEKKLHPLLYFISIIFFLGGLTAIKFVPYATILINALSGQTLYNNKDNILKIGNLQEIIDKVNQLIGKLPQEGLAFFLLCLIIFNCLSWISTPLNQNIVPKPAVDFIIKHNLQKNLVNTFGFGGYLIYRNANNKGETKYKVNIDGRTNLIPKDIWQEYVETIYGNLKFIKRYNPDTILWKWPSGLNGVLLDKSQWCLVFAYKAKKKKDPSYVVFVSKKIKENKNLTPIANFEDTNCKAKY